MELKLYIYAEWDSWNKKHNFSAFSFKRTDDRQLIEERWIELSPPPESVLQAGTVAAYQAEQARIKAEAHVKVNNIQTQIDEMLCLEHKVTE